MRRILVVAVLALTLAACSGDDETLSEIGDAQQACAELIDSGQAFTADDVQTCKGSNITMSYLCDDNATVIYKTTVDQIEWVFSEGATPQRPDSTDVDLRAFCS